jgi:NADH:ubiquinone oxidoreductase subunit 2 (subunit N)
MAQPQFSLRWLFVVTAAVALLLGEAVAFPDWLAIIAGILFVLFASPALVSGIVYGRGAVRAFFIGALAWWLGLGVLVVFLATFFHGVPAVEVFDSGRVDFCVLWLLDAVGGIVAVVVRRLAGREAPGRVPIEESCDRPARVE